MGTIRFVVGAGTFVRLLVLKGGLGGRAIEAVDLGVTVGTAKEVGLLVTEEVGVRAPVDLEVEATGGVEILAIGSAGGIGRGERMGVLLEVVDSPVEEVLVAFEGVLDIEVAVLPLLLDLITEAAAVAAADCRDVALTVIGLEARTVEAGGSIAAEVFVVVEVEVEGVVVAAGRFTGLVAVVRGVTVEGVRAVDRMTGDRSVEGVDALFSDMKVPLLRLGVMRKPVLEVETGGRLLIACKSSNDTSISTIQRKDQYDVKEVQ